MIIDVSNCHKLENEEADKKTNCTKKQNGNYFKFGKFLLENEWNHKRTEYYHVKEASCKEILILNDCFGYRS